MQSKYVVLVSSGNMYFRCGFYVAVVGLILVFCERINGLDNQMTITSHKSFKMPGKQLKSDSILSEDLKKTFNTFKRNNHISKEKSNKAAIKLKIAKEEIPVKDSKETKDFVKPANFSDEGNAKRQYIFGVPGLPSPAFTSSSSISRHLVAAGLRRGACLHHVCYHGGVCVRVKNGFYCDCPDQYIGAHCEFKRACLDNPCKNAGTCTELGHGDFTCNCAIGSKGKACELRNSCVPNPCNSDATCTEEEDGGYHCTCKLGYKGDRCQKKALCYPNPCKNGATCIDRDTRQFECSCATGFKGDLCEVFSECKNAPCINGGTCIEKAVGYRCACLKGFVGKNCEVTLCSPNPCANDGKCSIFGDRYNCACPKHYIGKHCEVLNPCRTNPCLNGGACVGSQSSSGDTNDGFSCKCPRGYYGNMCQMR